MKTIAFTLGAIIFFLSKAENITAQSSDTVVITQQVECNLPQIINTSTVLNPCSSPNGFGDLQIGDTVFIEYSPSNCGTICMQGTTVDITSFEIVLSTADLNEMNLADQFNFFPQPTTGELTIEIPQTVEAIELYSTQGQLVLQQKNNSNSINLTDLHPGIYIISVKTAKGIYTSKVSKI